MVGREADRTTSTTGLMRLGHGPRRAVAILWAWTALLSGVALLPAYTDSGNAMVPFLAALLALGPLHPLPPRCAVGPGSVRAHRHPAAVARPEVLSGRRQRGRLPSVVDLAPHRRKRA